MLSVDILQIQNADSKRQKYHHGDLKHALIQKGLEVIETEGMSGISLRKLAAHLGVSHTAPKNHFPSMRHLLTAIGAEGFQMFSFEMRAGIDEKSSRKDRLHAALEGYVRFAKRHPELFRMMFSPEFTDLKDDAVRAAAADSFQILSEISHKLQWDKSNEPNAQQRTEVMLWAFVHGYAMLLNTEQITDENGVPLFSLVDAMPSFDYGS